MVGSLAPTTPTTPGATATNTSSAVTTLATTNTNAAVITTATPTATAADGQSTLGQATDEATTADHKQGKADHVNRNEDASPSKLHGAMIAWVAAMIIALFKKNQDEEGDDGDSELD